MDDDLNVKYDVEVKLTNSLLSCPSLVFLITGSVCILIGFVDMIVFYVIPNNEIKKNKRDYPDYEFENPSKVLIAMHFLEHFFLILTGVVLLLGIIPNFYKTLTFLALIICIPLSFGIFYMINIIFGAISMKMNKKYDFTLNQITELYNNDHPLESVFIYVTGIIRKKKHNHICNSDEGVDFPTDSFRMSPDYVSNGKEPEFFYFQISQKVNMSYELSQYIERGKEQIISCENKFWTASINYPEIEGKNLISKGKKLPFKLTKKSGVVSIVFGVSIYYELYEKSIPIKKLTQEINAQTVDGLNYNDLVRNIDCDKIGKCDTYNKPPHK